MEDKRSMDKGPRLHRERVGEVRGIETRSVGRTGLGSRERRPHDWMKGKAG